MAITLDELLGRNTIETTTENFPSYEEFSSARNKSGYRVQENTSYDEGSVRMRNYSPAQTLPDYGQDIYGEDFIQPARRQNFYEYVARNNTQIDDSDLYNRLSRTNENMRPVFGRNDEVAAQRSTQATGAKVRGRLNTKGKIIVGSFLAVVVTVMSLIIAFAGKINNGTAMVPASNAAASVSSVVETL